MKKLNKILLALMLVTVVFMTGCKNVTTSMSYTYSLENGDTVKITLTTNDGYKITSGIPFDIKDGSDKISWGKFITLERYDEYVATAKNADGNTVIEEGTKDNYSYVMWNYRNSQYNYVIKLDGANSAILLSNTISEESAKEVLNRLDFQLGK